MIISAYQNKKVLITGHTGFKGSWLSAWLLELGAEVYGLSKDIPTTPSHFASTGLINNIHHFETDILDNKEVERIIQEVNPDYVFHLAAQPIVRLSYQNPIQTIKTNIIGTANILESLRGLTQSCNAIIITSDKCYDNVEWQWGYRETDTLGGKDPYSASKGGAELVCKTYFYSFFKDDQSPIRISTTRAGNVIGGGDWASDRIVPDCMNSWSQNKTVEIRSPQSTRPWQHVLEPLSGYLVLGANLSQTSSFNGESYNFGPPANQNYSVKDLITTMHQFWNNIQWKDVSAQSDQLHEAGLLKLCCDKALHQLNWQPLLNFEETVRFTVDWYRYFYENKGKITLNKTIEQINTYETLAQQRQIEWAVN